MSSFGSLFRVCTFGESHGSAVGVTIDGVPPRLPLSVADIQPYLDRRRPGQSKLTTSRNEADKAEILCGVENGLTLGSPITVIVKNQDKKPLDYSVTNNVPRPSHADFTYVAKYGIKADSGGGRSSARETIGRVIAGAVAEIWLNFMFGVEIVGWVSQVGKIQCNLDHNEISRTMVDSFETRCPDHNSSVQMADLISSVANEHDSIGGVVSCVCRNVPAGLGEPVFNKTEAVLASAMLSIPASKGFEVGRGFEAASMRGSEHNDTFVFKNTLKSLGTETNNSGGIQGGITNAENIYFRVAFKPAATISQKQSTSSYSGTITELEISGRHDPCIVIRAVPIVEAMAALVLADLALIQLSRVAASNALTKTHFHCLPLNPTDEIENSNNHNARKRNRLLNFL